MAFERFSRRLAAAWPLPDWGLAVFDSIDSTNAAARRMAVARDGDGEGRRIAVLAWEQTRGRGRLGRAWSSPPGAGVWASLLMPLAAEQAARLPLVGAVALCRRLERHLPGGCRVKWPNDLLAGGRKIGGLLVETVGGGERPRAAVLGFGVNYAAPDSAAGAATGLALESPAPPELADLAVELVSGVVADLPLAADAAGLAGSYRRLSVHRPGDRLRCRVGDRLVEGSFVGFDERGFLRLEQDGREVLMTAAEVVEH